MKSSRTKTRGYFQSFLGWLDGSTRKPVRKRAGGLRLEQLEDRTVPTLVAGEVKVLNTAGSSAPNHMVNLNGALYFAADDAVHGEELWTSNGTTAGTTLVKDIFPGPNSGLNTFTAGLTVAGNNLYFVAADPNDFQALWKSDGTTAGTTLVKGSGAAQSFSLFGGGLVAVGSSVFFIASDGTHGFELWKTDGTTAGTAMVTDINPGAGNAFPTNGNFGAIQMTAVGTNLFFTADNGNGHGLQLWKSDGTGAGTNLVADLGAGSVIQNLTNVNGTAYFTSADATHGTELWKSDGTTASLVKDIQPGVNGSNPANLTAFGNKLFFTADDGTNGVEPWISDGTPGGTQLVKVLNPNGSSAPHNLVTLGTHVYFFSFINGGDGLWQSDGTDAGTTLVKDLTPAQGFGNEANILTAVGSNLFFGANDGVHGNELWTSDTTTAGTVMVKDIKPGLRSGIEQTFGNFTNGIFGGVGSTLFFAANDGVHGTELWSSDGSAPNTVMVKDINPTNGDPLIANLTNLNGTLLFTATDDLTGNTWYKSDGTAGGTGKVANINPDGDFVPGTPGYSAVLGNNLLFAGDDGVNGTELWKTDGSAGGTTLVKDVNPGIASGIFTFGSNFAVMNGTLYFLGNDPTNGMGLWKSDGTTGGTTFVAAIAGGGVSPLTVLNGALYFHANDGAGVELWKSDGTGPGTAMLKVVQPGVNFGVLANYTVAGNNLFFTANNGAELWKSDGTADGTILLKQISATTLTAVGSTLYFVGSDATNGSELWKSDGTVGGTAIVKDLFPGANSGVFGFNNTFGVFGNKVFFDGFNPTDGPGLFESDGTAAGTVPVKANGFSASNFSVVGTKLYFTGNDGPHGSELWQTDGTAAGTHLAGDFLPGVGSSNPSPLFQIGNTLYFAANDSITSRQLWAGHEVLGISSISSTTANGSYAAGTAINVTVTFDSPVTLAGGNLTLNLNSGGSVTIAPFTNSATASGTYTVAPGQAANPLDVNSPLVLANGTTLKNGGGTDVLLAIQSGLSLKDSSTIVVNAAAGVTSVTSTTADGVYGVGAPINVTLHFSNPLTLAGGNLTVGLNSGGSVTFAPFSNQTTASGTYTVAAGQFASPLDTTSPMTLAAGATLKDGSGNDAGLTIPVGSSLGARSITVDAVAAAVSSVTSTTVNGTYGIGAAINVTVNFSKPLTLTGGNLQITLNNGKTVTVTPFANATTASGTYTVAAGDTANPLDTNSPFTLTAGATLQDGFGNNSALTIPAGQSLKNNRSLVVNGIAAGITGVTTTTANGTYGTGAPITVKLTFSSPVTLAGGNLTVNMNSLGTVTITPFSNSTTATGVYTVAAGEHAAQLDTNSPLVLAAGATLKDGASNNAVLTIPAGQSLKDVGNIVVDAVAPAITAVTSTTANGTYGVGAPINVTVTFGKAVTLAGGNLTIGLNDGASVVVTPFSNSTTASGTYTVAAGDTASRLDTNSPLTLAAGATLKDNFNNTATLVIPVGQSLQNNSNIIVDTVVPALASITSTTASGTYGIGAAINVTATFSKPVTLTGGNLTVALNSGGSVTFTPFANQTVVSGTYNVAAGQTANPLDTTSPITLAAGATLKDAAGNASALTIPAGQSLKDSKTFVLDANAPVISSITSTTANGTYTTGAPINVTVTFSKAVTLAGGNLTINLNSGGSVTLAPFANQTTASGTYTVATGDQASPLDTNSPLVLAAGATLKDAAGNNSALVIPAGQSLKNNSTIVVDAVVPAVSSVTSTTPNGTYGIGAPINVTVNFSKPLTLAGGNLTVALNDGGIVTFTPFANAATATGTYTVASGDTANPLDTTSPLTLAGGATLKDAAGNAATLTIPAGQSLKNTSTFVVNGVAAKIASVSSTTASGSYGIGAPVNVTVTFDHPVTLAGGNLTIGLNDGGSVVVAPFVNSATASGTYAVAVGDTANPLDTNSPLTLGAGATIKDSAGNNTALGIPAGQSLKDAKSIVINGVAPKISSVSSTTANGVYTPSATINVTVTFSEPVTLAGGNLTIGLNSGGTVTVAPFTNSATASGTYTVAVGQTANPLDTNSPLTLGPGATLKNAVGNNATLAIPAGQSLKSSKTFTVANATPTGVAVKSGGGQSATVNSAFAAPLVVTVTDSLGNPVPGVLVTFAGPGSGAGVTFAGGTNTATTDITGRASVAVSANGVAGPVTVNATVASVANPAAFTLTNNVVAVANGKLAFSAAAYSFDEKGGTITLTVTRTAGTDGTVSAKYDVSVASTLATKYQAVPNTDFTGTLSGVVTLNPGDAQKSITFAITADNLVEENKSFIVTLSQPTGGATLGSQTSTTVTILDNHLPTVLNATPKLPTLQKAGIGFGTSDEHYQQFVRTAYDHYLRRKPLSDLEVQYWVDLMKTYQNDHTKGLKQEQIEAGFIDSKEYIGRFGTVGKAWIDGIYADLLSRAPDASGEAFWLGQLNAGVDPTLVALGFTTSLERLQNRVSATYLTLLERPADKIGLAYWVGIFNGGGTTEDINSGFVGSVEYYNKANGAAGNPAKWVREAYLDVLFRAAKTDELTFWLNFLNS